MTVLYIIHATVMGGATISFKSLIEGVIGHGVKPIIVYPKKQYNDTIKYFESIGCDCYSSFIALSSVSDKTKLLKKYYFFLRMILLKLFSIINLLRIVRKVKPDVIHTNTGVVHEGYFVAKLLNIPHVWHIREYQTKDFNWSILPSKKKFEKRLSKSFDIFITQALQQYFNQGNKTSKVIYNPIFDFEDTTVVKSNAERYFCVANRISPEKGIEDIINGYALFCKDCIDYKLKIAGFGEETYIAELKHLCKKLNILDNVQFLGYVSDMRELIYNAKILFVGSYYEAFGRMTAEANLLETFVIGRNTGGTKEILELTHGGSLFDKYEEIPVLIKNYLNSDNKEMTIAKEIALKYFSKKNHCNKVFEVYNYIKGN